MPRKRKETKGRDLLQYDKEAMKVVHEYRKIRRKELGSSQIDNKSKMIQRKKQKAFATNKILLAQQDSAKKEEEKKQFQATLKKNLALRDQKRRNRSQVHKKLTAKTSKGQPVLNNQIGFLLDKIIKNKSASKS